MDAERWDRVKDLFDAALGRPPAARAAFLKAACGDDARLYHELTSLLRAQADAESWLDGRAVDAITLPDAASFKVERIGRYGVDEVLGAGGMGVVYRAHDPAIGRTVAIKVVADRVWLNSEVKERFKREARAQGALAHENITVVHDVGEEGGRPFIVMEYLEGESLRAVMSRAEPLPLERKLDIALQICRGLHYAHSKNVVHRDVKPANIHVLPDGKVKILDFGIAKPEASALTRTGATMGTPAYMSPEQVQGYSVDKRSDVFSFGIVFYELLSNENPFAAETTTSIMYKIVHAEPQKVVLKDGAFEEPVQRILAGCLAKDREDRVPDLGPVIRRLEHLLHQLRTERLALGQAETVTDVRALRGRTARRPLSRRPVPAVLRYGLVGVGLAVLAVAGVLLFDRSLDETNDAADGPGREAAVAAQAPVTDRDGATAADSLAQDAAETLEDRPPAPEEDAGGETGRAEARPPREREASPGDRRPPDRPRGEAVARAAVEQARTDAAAARLQVPGRQGDKDDDASYRRAVAAEARAGTLAAAGANDSAVVVFRRAAGFYEEAATRLLARLRQRADEARDAVDAMQARLDGAGQTHDAYRRARQAEADGARAYEAGDFDEAYDRYQQARTLFAEVVIAQGDAARDLVAVRQAVDRVKARFRESIQQEDLDRLRSLYLTFSKDEEEKWSTLFRYFDVVAVSVGEETVDVMDERTTTLDVLFEIDYKDNRNRPNRQTYKYTWTLEEVEGAWKIVRFTAR